MKYLPIYLLCFLTSCSQESELAATDAMKDLIGGANDGGIVGEYTGKTAERFPYKITAFTRLENRDSKSKITITALYGNKPTIEKFGEYLVYGKLEWTPGSNEYLYFGAQEHDSGIPGLERWFYPKQSISNFTLGTKVGGPPVLLLGTWAKPKDNYKYTIYLTNEDSGQGEGNGQRKGLPPGEGAKSLSDLKSRLTGKK